MVAQKTEYRSRSTCASLPVSMIPSSGTYDDLGGSYVDKALAVYDLGETVITVQRVFENRYSKNELLKEYIEDQQRKWYNDHDNIVAASQRKEGK